MTNSAKLRTAESRQVMQVWVSHFWMSTRILTLLVAAANCSLTGSATKPSVSEAEISAKMQSCVRNYLWVKNPSSNCRPLPSKQWHVLSSRQEKFGSEPTGADLSNVSEQVEDLPDRVGGNLDKNFSSKYGKTSRNSRWITRLKKNWLTLKKSENLGNDNNFGGQVMQQQKRTTEL